TLEQLSSLERMGEKSAQNFLDGIEASKKRELWRLIFGLGILHVGAGVAKSLARNYESLDALAGASLEQLTETEDIGEVIAQSFEQRQQENGLCRCWRGSGIEVGKGAATWGRGFERGGIFEALLNPNAGPLVSEIDAAHGSRRLEKYAFDRVYLDVCSHRGWM